MSTLNKYSLVSELPVFPLVSDLPQTLEDAIAALNSDTIREVHSHALGPAGTNIVKAAELWHRSMGITRKAHIIECETPEQGLSRSRAAKQEGMLHVFWTCAVYFNEYELFFNNPDTLPFMFQIVSPLDDMQLACRPESAATLLDNSAVRRCRILSHPSPASLVRNLPAEVMFAKSNADAAIRCSRGEAEACITTETARRLHGLIELHRFGRPPMVFFGGVSSQGADLLRRSLAEAKTSMPFQAKAKLNLT